MKPEFPRREKDRIDSELRNSPLPTLEDKFDLWRRQNPYSQFHLFGIWDPPNYSWVQEIISQGLDAWQEHSVTLFGVANWHAVVIPQEAIQIVEAILAGEIHESDRPLQTLERHHDSPAESLKQYVRDCGNFFSQVARHGLARATVVLAANENWEKPHRRHERLAHVLELCLPDLEERLRLFRQVIASPESTENASNCQRWKAICFLPGMLKQDARLATILRELLQDEDDLVRYHAADHLSTLEPEAIGLGENLLIAFRKRVSDGYDDCGETDARFAQMALSRLGPLAVMRLAQPLADQQSWIELTRCCEVLARWELPEVSDFLGKVREKLSPRIPQAWYDHEKLARSTLELLVQACSWIHERWANDEATMWSNVNVEKAIDKYRPRRNLDDWLLGAAKLRLSLTRTDQIQEIRSKLETAWRITCHDLTTGTELPDSISGLEVLVSQALISINELEKRDPGSGIDRDLLTAFEQISELHRLRDASNRGDKEAKEQLGDLLAGIQ